jgi:hypothetical protein
MKKMKKCILLTVKMIQKKNERVALFRNVTPVAKICSFVKQLHEHSFGRRQENATRNLPISDTLAQ